MHPLKVQSLRSRHWYGRNSSSKSIYKSLLEYIEYFSRYKGSVGGLYPTQVFVEGNWKIDKGWSNLSKSVHSEVLHRANVVLRLSRNHNGYKGFSYMTHIPWVIYIAAISDSDFICRQQLLEAQSAVNGDFSFEQFWSAAITLPANYAEISNVSSGEKSFGLSWVLRSKESTEICYSWLQQS